MVHAEPRAPQASTYSKRFARWHRLGLAVHDLTAVQQAGQLFIELHLEVDENLSLREAHRQPDWRRNSRIARRPIEWNIHIERWEAHRNTGHGCWGDEAAFAAIEEFLNRLPSEFDELVKLPRRPGRKVEHHILVSCHCTMKAVCRSRRSTM